MNVFSLQIKGWTYRLEQDVETGDLYVAYKNHIGENDANSRVKVPTKSVIQKAAEYVKAEASLLVDGKLSLDVVGQRKTACDSCEGVDKKSETDWYCNRCGCPKWERSRLQVKWEMPGATCPMGKWPKVG